MSRWELASLLVEMHKRGKKPKKQATRKQIVNSCYTKPELENFCREEGYSVSGKTKKDLIDLLISSEESSSSSSSEYDEKKDTSKERGVPKKTAGRASKPIIVDNELKVFS